MPLETFSPADMERALRVFREALALYRGELNRLNVYPVPDGDTGTNMGLTLEAVLADLDGTSEGPPALRLAQAMSHGSLMGARGNSGVILSQILRGLAGVVRSEETLGPPELARALRAAAEGAYGAVSNPVEGTMLSVARAAAQGAEEALASGHPRGPRQGAGAVSLVAVLEGARDAAAKALERTTEQLPALAAAGVVDAGGAGLLLLYDAMLYVAAGREVQAPPLPTYLQGAAGPQGSAGEVGLAERAGRRAPSRAEAGEVSELRYEVMFFLEAPDDAISGFREVWDGYGGSVVIVGGDGLYNCHIHTDDIGGAIEAAIEIGRPRQIRVTDLAEQVEEERWVREAAGLETVPLPGKQVTTSVVAVCAGEGVKRVFRSLGVRHFVAGGQSANPTVAELLGAIADASAEQVVVLPNNPNVVAAAERAASASGKKVRVVPTTSIAEGFAALVSYDPEADLDTNADAMAQAAARVLPGEVVQASREASTLGGPVRKGDWLGLSRGELKVVVPKEAGPEGAATALLAALVPEQPEEGYEMVTLIEGEGSSAASTRRIVEWLAEERPWLVPEVHHGGQPLYPYVFGVE